MSIEEQFEAESIAFASISLGAEKASDGETLSPEFAALERKKNAKNTRAIASLLSMLCVDLEFAATSIVTSHLRGCPGENSYARQIQYNPNKLYIKRITEKAY